MSPLNATSNFSPAIAAVAPSPAAPNSDAARITALGSMAGVTVRLLISLPQTLGRNFDARA